MIIVVTGSRDWTDLEVVESELLAAVADRPYGDPVTIRHGAARGLDVIAADVAHGQGWGCEPWPAEWDTHGKAAGGIRNQAMLDADPPPDKVVAFPIAESRGTWDMVRRARKAGIETVIVGVQLEAPGEGYTYRDTAPCRGCRATIHWWETPNGKLGPYDPDGTSHFASCPKQAEFRRQR